MQFQKVIRWIMILILNIIFTSCSYEKNFKKNANKEFVPINNNSIYHSKNFWFKKYIYKNIIDEFKKNNVIYFDSDRYNINSNFTSILDINADYLENNPSLELTIEGHTDECGTPEYNISLGERRANSVKMYLQSRGVPIDQMKIISYGKEIPAVVGHNESAYSKNRRAVLIYK